MRVFLKYIHGHVLGKTGSHNFLVFTGPCVGVHKYVDNHMYVPHMLLHHIQVVKGVTGNDGCGKYVLHVLMEGTRCCRPIECPHGEFKMSQSLVEKNLTKDTVCDVNAVPVK